MRQERGERSEAITGKVGGDSKGTYYPVEEFSKTREICSEASDKNHNTYIHH